MGMYVQETRVSSGNASRNMLRKIVFVAAMLKTKAACGAKRGLNKDRTTL